MKKIILSLVLLFIKTNTTTFDWTIIGAGPAGITTIGVLLDVGIPENKIAWIDPEFKVGRLPNYNNVPANNPTSKFIEFIQNCDTFKKCDSPELAELLTMNPKEHHPLKIITKPLKCITKQLRTKVNSFETKMHYLFFENDTWSVLTTSGETINSKNVVIATGSQPKNLSLHTQGTQIPLDVALDKYQLATVVNENDTIAVIGSAHSAILILKFLCDLNVKQIYNFYNKELIVKKGAKMRINPMLDVYGVAAQWIKEVLSKNPPKNLERLKSTSENLETILPECTKTIYAVGYKRNDLPEIRETSDYSYDKQGAIGPRLFGIGIAFPEMMLHHSGELEPKVGLRDFLNYAQRMVPAWVSKYYDNKKRSKTIQQQTLLQILDSILDIKLL